MLCAGFSREVAVKRLSAFLPSRLSMPLADGQVGVYNSASNTRTAVPTMDSSAIFISEGKLGLPGEIP